MSNSIPTNKPTPATYISIFFLTVGGILSGNLFFSYSANAQFNYYPNQGYQQQSQTTPVTSFDQNLTRYIVYVDGDNFQVLQRIREIENTAYIRQYNGRRIIQSGVFNRPDNAQQRVRELAINGIPGAQILQVSTTQEMPTYVPQNNQIYNQYPNQNNYNNNIDPRNIYQQSYYEPNNPPNNQQAYYQPPNKDSKAYYVVIPSDNNKMRSLGEEIAQKIANNATVYLKTQPYGPHIAIGPFPEKSEAELWNNYIRKLGYGNARIYYGR